MAERGRGRGQGAGGGPSSRRGGGGGRSRGRPEGGRGRGGKQSADRPGARSGGGSGPRSGERGPGGGRRPPGRRAAQGLGGDQIEGRHAVRELLLAGRRRVREIYLADDLDPADIIEDIVSLAHELDVPVRTVGRKRLQTEAASANPQGVVARAAPLPEADLDRLASRPGAFLLVLDGITDPGNLGAILRTAECTGVTGIVLPRHRSVHISPTVTKSAAGAVEHLPMAVVGGIPTAVSDLADRGVLTVGLDAAGTTDLFTAEAPLDGPVALVLGAEGRGLSRLVRQRVDMLVAIPLAGSLNSLNVSAAAAVACFEVVRRRTQASAGAARTIDTSPTSDGGDL